MVCAVGDANAAFEKPPQDIEDTNTFVRVDGVLWLQLCCVLAGCTIEEGGQRKRATKQLLCIAVRGNLHTLLVLIALPGEAERGQQNSASETPREEFEHSPVGYQDTDGHS